MGNTLIQSIFAAISNINSQKVASQLDLLARLEDRQATVRACAAAEGVSQCAAAAATACTWVLKHLHGQLLQRGRLPCGLQLGTAADAVLAGLLARAAVISLCIADKKRMRTSTPHTK